MEGLELAPNAKCCGTSTSCKIARFLTDLEPWVLSSEVKGAKDSFLELNTCGAEVAE